MSVGDIFSKTPAGVQEVSARKMKLPPRLRTMLILIDGKQPLFVLKEEAEKVGAPKDFLELLLAMALINKTGTVATSEGTATTSVPVSAQGDTPDESFARFRQAKDFMNVSIVNAMGIKSFFFTLKLERAGNLDDLRGLLDAYKEAIGKASGNAEAEVLTERLRDMLG